MRLIIRWCRCAQPPANFCDPCRGQTRETECGVIDHPLANAHARHSSPLATSDPSSVSRYHARDGPTPCGTHFRTRPSGFRMSTGRALQQILRSWHSAGLSHVQRVAAREVVPAVAGPVASTPVSIAPPPPALVEDDQTDMARKSSASKAATSLELPIIAVAPEVAQKGSRESRLAALAARVAQCTRCHELATTRTQTVLGVGNPNARVMFIGEAPGADEDEQGEPFVGRAGQLLTKIIGACGWTREELYICNILRSAPPRTAHRLQRRRTIAASTSTARSRSSTPSTSSAGARQPLRTYWAASRRSASCAGSSSNMAGRRCCVPITRRTCCEAPRPRSRCGKT